MKSITRNGLTVAICAGLFGLAQNASALTLDKTFEDAYIATDGRAGKGATMAVFPNIPGDGQGTVFFAFYTQNEAAGGAQYWVAGNTTYQVGQNVFTFDLFSAEGGVFGDGGNQASEVVGSGTLTVNSCGSMVFDYSFSGPAIDAGSIELVPLSGPSAECVYDSPFPGTCPAGTTGSDGLCVIQGTLTSDIALTNNNIYQISGGVFVGNDLGASGEGGVTLSAEPGTVIVGATGQDFLAVARGNKIVLRGTADAPVVLTSADAFVDVTAGASAQWGGLIINGQSILNAGSPCGDGTPDCLESQGEGGSGLYGGVDPDDNSGVLHFVRVEYAGNLISDLDELNGIAFQGVGAGTYVDSIQVHENADDGVEFFGGTVNAKRVVLTNIGDDSVDWTQGWQGRLQYVLIQQGAESDRGIEADNNSSDNDAEPRARGRLANFTIQGGGGVTDHAILFREGTNANMTHSIAMDGPGGRNDSCFDIDQDSTFANAANGGLTVTGLFLDCAVPFEDIEGDGPNEFSVEEFFNAGAFNAQLDITFENGYQLPAGSPLLDAPDIPRGLTGQAGQQIFDSFFDNPGFAGAVGEYDWTDGWTQYLFRGPVTR